MSSGSSVVSAERLREAAALMRSRAESVTEADPGDWYTTKNIDTPFGRWAGDEDAAHIASWHPAVALAVADWLDASADVVDAEVRDRCGPGLGTRNALAVANAYLGGDS